MAIITPRNMIRIDGFSFLGFGLLMTVQMFFGILPLPKLKIYNETLRPSTRFWEA